MMKRAVSELSVAVRDLAAGHVWLPFLWVPRIEVLSAFPNDQGRGGLSRAGPPIL